MTSFIHSFFFLLSCTIIGTVLLLVHEQSPGESVGSPIQDNNADQLMKQSPRTSLFQFLHNWVEVKDDLSIILGDVHSEPSPLRKATFCAGASVPCGRISIIDGNSFHGSKCIDSFRDFVT